MLLRNLKVIGLLSCLLWSSAIFAQTAFSSLEERMTGAEFSSSGLDKLSAEELVLLNKWLRDHSVVKYESAAVGAGVSQATAYSKFSQRDNPGYAAADRNFQEHESFHAKLIGNITGWNDSTVFRLDNGMVWEMAEKDTFYIKEVKNPGVEIRSGMFNTWKLLIEGHNSSTRVKRIQ